MPGFDYAISHRTCQILNEKFYLIPKPKEHLRGHKVSNDENIIGQKRLSERAGCYYFGTMEFMLWRNTVSSAHQLQEKMTNFYIGMLYFLGQAINASSL